MKKERLFDINSLEINPLYISPTEKRKWTVAFTKWCNDQYDKYGSQYGLFCCSFMKICQEFAMWNRRIIVENILAYLHNYQNCDLSLYEYNYFDTIHNYISFEDNIVRKGAIEAYDNGKLLLIPMNMRDGCIIAKGKGNKDWNCSAPHGAGRIMSRVAAKKILDVKEFEKSMENIYTTTANELTIDEAPMAYKPAQEIIDNIKDTVEIIKIIKPIYNFKATE